MWLWPVHSGEQFRASWPFCFFPLDFGLLLKNSLPGFFVKENYATPHQRWGGDILLCPPTKGEWGHIGFSVDPIGVGVTESCTHDICWTSWWNATTFACIYHWDKLRSWIGFGGLIFKVTRGFRYMKFSLKIRYLMSHCLDCHQTCKDLPEGWFQEYAIFWWPWFYFWGQKPIYRCLNFHYKWDISFTNWWIFFRLAGIYIIVTGLWHV